MTPIRSNRLRAFLQLVLARMREFFREPIAIFWVYGFPLILAMILGLAFKGATVVPPTIDIVVDSTAPAEPAAAARERLVAVLEKDGVEVVKSEPEDAKKRLRQTKTSLVITAHIGGGLTFDIDPTRPDAVNAKYRVQAALERDKHPDAIRPEERDVKTPGSRYIDFLLPGLVGTNLMGGGLFGIGFVLVETRTRKLFKRLMATPMHRGDYLLAMISTRLVFLIPEMFVLLVVARWIFGVPVQGSWGTLILVVAAGALTFAGLGLLIGCRTEKTETASGLLNLVMMPQYLLSGVFFSSKNFPDFLQPLVQALPLTQLINALRAVMLEGEGLRDVLLPLAIMAAWGLSSFFLALRWFKWA